MKAKIILKNTFKTLLLLFLASCWIAATYTGLKLVAQRCTESFGRAKLSKILDNIALIDNKIFDNQRKFLGLQIINSNLRNLFIEIFTQEGPLAQDNL